MSLPLIWMQFLVATTLILAVSSFLAKSTDVIAIKTGLGRTFIGVLLLASATSLPELATGLSSVTVIGLPDLAAGDAFGSNLVNLLIIGLMDIKWRNGPILNSFDTGIILVAGLGILLISLAAIAIIVHHSWSVGGTWFLSPFSLVLISAFLFSLYLVFWNEKSKPNDDPLTDYSNNSLGFSVLVYLLSASVIVGSAIWLAFTGEQIARVMNWESSFVGTQFLAFSTSLPELAASFAALRILAPELAISNVLGSNLFNMGFVLWADDLAYSGGVFWSAISPIHTVTASVAVIMTIVVILGVIRRDRKRPSKFLTYESVALISLYLLASMLIYLAA